MVRACVVIGLFNDSFLLDKGRLFSLLAQCQFYNVVCVLRYLVQLQQNAVG